MKAARSSLRCRSGYIITEQAKRLAEAGKAPRRGPRAEACLLCEVLCMRRDCMHLLLLGKQLPEAIR